MAKRKSKPAPRERKTSKPSRRRASSPRKPAAAAKLKRPAQSLTAERKSDAARKKASRAAGRDLNIPPPADPSRRAACLADPFLFFPTYFPGVFYQPFTTDRREMTTALLHAAKYGGDQSVAGPRGDGKTRIVLFGSLFLALRGELEFPLIISKSGPRAARELRNLKEAIRDSAEFAADFPEIVLPIRDLGGWGSRARQQTVGGSPTNMEWGEDVIILPTIADATLRKLGWPAGIESAACGQIIASLGIEGPIRGYTVRNVRPDAAILDDIDSRESAQSETQTEDRERIIEEDVGGLAGPDKTIARLMLCTLLNHKCIAATFTDRTKKQSWRGQRHKLLATMPTREDLWAEYIQLRQGRDDDDANARVAHRFYMAHRAEMDAGAVVTNEHRFDSRPLDDGESKEVSALQACYNLIADRGLQHFLTEYNNDPPAEIAAMESGITPHRIQRQLSGYARLLVPPGVVLLAVGIDVRKTAMHYVVVGWTAEATGYVAEYGVHEVLGTIYGSDEGLDLIIRRAALNLLAEISDRQYVKIDGGEIVRPVIGIMDSGWRTDAIYAACAEAATAGIRFPVLPIKGFGKSSGCTAANFWDIQHRTLDKRPGDGWFLSRQGSLWLVCADADRWKTWTHDRWMTAPGKPGCLYLYGTPGQPGGRLSIDEKAHHSFAHHQCNEAEVEELIKGKLVRHFKAKSENTHWLDALYYSAVGASIKGIRLPMTQTAKPTRELPGQQSATPAASASAPSLADLARLAKGR